MHFPLDSMLVYIKASKHVEPVRRLDFDDLEGSETSSEPLEKPSSRSIYVHVLESRKREIRWWELALWLLGSMDPWNKFHREEAEEQKQEEKEK